MKLCEALLLITVLRHNLNPHTTLEYGYRTSFQRSKLPSFVIQRVGVGNAQQNVRTKPCSLIVT
jgi:hypothetical protein